MNFTFNVEIKNDYCYIDGKNYGSFSNGFSPDPANTFGNNMYDYIQHMFDKANGLYNKAVYWPQTVQFALQWTLAKRYEIQPTQHMQEKLKLLNLPAGCYKAMLYGEVIEAEMYHGTVEKIVTRLPHRFDNTLDLCAAIVFEDDEARVKTMWVNRRNDNHYTICKENYVTEETV